MRSQTTSAQALLAIVEYEAASVEFVVNMLRGWRIETAQDLQADGGRDVAGCRAA